MKKIYKKIILCIVGIVLLIAIASRFASLDEKISWSNRSYLKIVNVRNVDVDNYDKTVDVNFTIEYYDGLKHNIVKNIIENSKKIVYKDNEYKDYKLTITMFSASKQPLFSVEFNSENDIEKIHCVINKYGNVLLLSEISKYFPNVKNLWLDDIYSFHVPKLEDWEKTKNPVYEEYCNVENYKRFTNLESIEFCVKPRNEAINYIKEKFPNCELKYGMVIE